MASNELLTKFQNALVELETLRITTCVGSSRYDPKTQRFDADPADATKAICTSIKLLSGDVTTVIHPDFVTGPLQALREYHAKKEDQGMAIVKANLEVIERFFEFLKKLELEK